MTTSVVNSVTETDLDQLVFGTVVLLARDGDALNTTLIFRKLDVICEIMSWWNKCTQGISTIRDRENRFLIVNNSNGLALKTSKRTPFAKRKWRGWQHV